MANVKVARIAGGKDAGKLRVTVEVTLREHDEVQCSKKFDCESTVRENLKQSKLQRGVGPIGAVIANAMVDAVNEACN